ncbi:MAG: TetR/AcrR family transcriptional regulator [Kofleriaceae bacterium]|nr:TetR/AcrR family transcriptional regulator [Kofleriaceae bacterium]
MANDIDADSATSGAAIAGSAGTATATGTDKLRLARRRQILDAAIIVFAEHGYHGASIGQIIERAEIARGTFYLYFQSKAAVFASILDQAMADLRTLIHRIEVTAPDAPPPQVQLRAQLIATIDYVAGNRALATLLLQAGHTPDADAAERLGRFWAEIRALFVRALETGTELGLLRRCEPEITAAALLGMARGVVELLVLAPGGHSVEGVVGELLMVALRGILK